MSDLLVLKLVVPEVVPVGRPVPMVLHVSNHARAPLDLYLRGRTLTFDVEVSREDSTFVWRRLQGEIVPAIVHVRALAPGERIEASAVWDQRASLGGAAGPGSYLARGFLLTEETPFPTLLVGFRIAGREG